MFQLMLPNLGSVFVKNQVVCNFMAWIPSKEKFSFYLQSLKVSLMDLSDGVKDLVKFQEGLGIGKGKRVYCILSVNRIEYSC